MTAPFPVFEENCQSLLCRYLSREIFAQLKDRITANGYTFLQAIESGIVNQDSHIGVYAGDAESYQLFAELFDPIIADYHQFSPADRHRSNLDAASAQLDNPDPGDNYIVSTRIRVGRNIDAMPLGPAVSRYQRRVIEEQVVAAVRQLEGELAGEYFPLTGMGESVRERLVADHFLFKAGDRFLAAAGLNRDWPDGRGIFHNTAKTFLLWVNEEDQLRIISMQPGGDLKAVFSRLVSAVNAIEKSVPFLYDQRLGYLTSCPTNLGTALRASVHIRLPKLADNVALFQEITEKHHLQIRGIHGEHSESEGAVFDVSNSRRLGVTEVECVEDLYNGVVTLIDCEESL